MTGQSLMKPALAKVIGVKKETPGIKTFTIRYVDSKKQSHFSFVPGQFLMASLFGYGEMPISISSSPFRKGSLQLTVMDAGNVSHAMHKLGKGAIIGLRGPFGNGFPIAMFMEKNIVFISGGCGMAPLRSVVFAAVSKRKDFSNLTLLYGCKTPRNLLFKKDIADWKKVKNFNVLATVDEPTPEWKGHTGVVTKLFGKVNLEPKNSVACIVGPPVMAKFAINGLKGIGFRDEQIWVSLERLMHCGVGKCAHCNVGSKQVCIDGPVFNGVELAKMPLEER